MAGGSGSRADRDARAHVLLVEDDEDMREIVTILFASHGYRVSEATSGDQAMALLSGMPAPPDLVVMDIVMAGMSGLDVIREMRRSPRLAGIPVVVLSGVPRRADEAGLEISEWILKPPPVKALLDVAERLTRW
jgi:CheY-like chemotaxis protein